MAKLPTIQDPTLAAVDAALEARENAQPARRYLGMSSIGKSCSRALWYSFRWCARPSFSASTLKRFADGHHGEDVQAERLRMVPGVRLHTHTADGSQYGFSDLGGHFRGHMDGVIEGLLQAPKTPHVWEHKQTDEKKQQKLEALKIELGEKNALAQWDAVYYAQGVLYMHYAGISRHYLTCATPGGRHTISCRTEANEAEALRLKAKAARIIATDSPDKLDKISESPAWYECKLCDARDLCHGQAIPPVNCRTCIHATPEMDGDGRWSCAKFGGATIPEDVERTGCGVAHLYIPALLSNWAEQVDIDERDESIIYRNRETGEIFKNGPAPGYTSAELAIAHQLAGDPNLATLKEQFGAEVVA